MQLLLIILGSLATLFALILLVAAVMRKNYSVERNIVISQPRERVYDYLRHLKNQDHFSKWVMRDPHMKKTFTGTDGEVGFVYAWDGNKQAGAGEEEIMALTPNERIDVEIRFIRPFAAIAQTPFLFEDHDGGTKVTWAISSSMRYPLNVMLPVMNIEKLLGRDMEESLHLLKKRLEQS